MLRHRAVLQAVHDPLRIGAIMPVRSASGTKALGMTSPRSPSAQRISASTPTMSLVVKVDQRLVVQHELLAIDRPPQPAGHRQPRHRVATLAFVQAW